MTHGGGREAEAPCKFALRDAEAQAHLAKGQRSGRLRIEVGRPVEPREKRFHGASTFALASG
jgi:hypothetical protein